MGRKQPERTKHVHRFIKLHGRRVNMWRCSLDGCAYLCFTGNQDILLGRYSLCWDCGRSFPMGEDNLEEEMPTCILCKSKNEGLEASEINRMIREKTNQ